jgi:DNA polymerase elongation subunit (family B)
MDHKFKLYEFNTFNKSIDKDSDEETSIKRDTSQFVIQMFGLNKEGQKASIFVEDYLPFFYLKVNNQWNQNIKNAFYTHLKQKLGKYYENSIIKCKLIEKQKLYGFDASKKHRFVKLSFSNITVFNKVKNFWYVYEDNESKLIENGYKFEYNGKITNIELYDVIPPLLRAFHIREISPSGWIELPSSKTLQVNIDKKTTCSFEFIISYKNIISLNQMDDVVPYTIMSMDIEASSSHGDFPVPIKTYKKLATNIVDYFDKLNTKETITKPKCINILKKIIHVAFNFDNDCEYRDINMVYTKSKIDITNLNIMIDKWLQTTVKDNKINVTDEIMIDSFFEKIGKELKKEQVKLNEHNEENNNEENNKENNKENKEDNNEDEDEDEDNNEDNNEDEDEDDNKDDENEDDEENELEIEENELEIEERNFVKRPKVLFQKTFANHITISDILCDATIEREHKMNELIKSLKINFPALEGDKVTFIGSTFMKYGDETPYLNHCIVLNSCENLTIPNAEIETYDTEREVLLAWTNLVQRQDPDIILGYNIFSFDYEFMFRRAQELNCVEDFLKLSKNKDEICNTYDFKNPDKIDIFRSTTTVASGTYELSIIKMNGRLQIDMLNWFRKSENLVSYKLDYVGSYFIGDNIKSLNYIECKTDDTVITRINTTNIVGLQLESYIHFKEMNNTTNYYKNGQKFKVINISKEESWFEINGRETPKGKIIKWGLAKDDVTPKDIFRMTNEGPKSRAIIAKYCIQDCNLVQYLFNKVDVLTSLIEMSKLCSVPMSFLIFRGQGIKLTSYVAKKCFEKHVLMPCINKGNKNDGYEGAIVLPPKCGLYLDRAVNVGDFASLYPSSMISENLCPSSKVWTKTYDLAGNIIEETGIKGIKGKEIINTNNTDTNTNNTDTNTNNTYTDTNNTYKDTIYIYDNLPGYEYVNITFDTYKYIRKTPKSKPQKVKSGYKECRFAQPFNNERAIMPSILQELLQARKDTRKLKSLTRDEFMKNVLEKRQLAYKVTANSLYGQLGSKTSAFYEPDIAASTTATGRLYLIFAKRIIEECYNDEDVESSCGLVNVKSEYIYGDTDSVFFKLELTDKLTGEKIIDEKYLGLSIEIAQKICHEVSKVLKQPHDFEYEKTFMPFCLLAKKKYVSIKYEFDPKKGKRDDNGIVLKRRDNASIVKDVYGGTIDILMKEKNIKNALCFVETMLNELINGNINMEKLIISKALNSFYKNPLAIAHKVLADRIAERDPGNKPTSGDRIEFIYIDKTEKSDKTKIDKTKIAKGKKGKEKILQGDKIETPTFIKENNLQIDYKFYITNQIMKPLIQLFGLVLKELWLSESRPNYTKIANYEKAVQKIKDTEEDYEKKINKLCYKHVEELIFSKFIKNTDVKTKKITNYFVSFKK